MLNPNKIREESPEICIGCSWVEGMQDKDLTPLKIHSTWDPLVPSTEVCSAYKWVGNGTPAIKNEVPCVAVVFTFHAGP